MNRIAQLARRLREHIDAHPRSAISRSLGYDADEFSDILNDAINLDMEANIDVAALQARIATLEQQLQQQQERQHDTQAPKTRTPFKFDTSIRCNAEKVADAREFLRHARAYPDLCENASDAILKRQISLMLTGQAARWADDFHLRNPDATFPAFLEAFEEAFVSSKEVQSVALSKLYAAQQRTSLEQLYTFIQQQLAILTDKPSDAHLVHIYTAALRDKDVKLHVASNKPTTLIGAHTLAMEQESLIRSLSNRRPGAPRQ